MSVFKKRAPLLAVIGGTVVVFGLIVALVYSHVNDTLQKPTETANTATDPSVSFAAVGDFDTTPNSAAVLARIAQAKPDFTLALGDLAYDTVPSEKVWCDSVKKALGNTHPFELVAGNHDTEESSKRMHIDRYAKCLPNRMANMQGDYGQQYFFDYSSLVRVIMISPGMTISGHTYTYQKDSADYTWLQEAIAGARQAQKQWLVVGMHKNCLSVGEKTCEIGQDLMNMLVESKVDLVLQGHEHAYMRTKQLQISKDCPSISITAFNQSCVQTSQDDSFTQYQARKGTIFAIVGTGGAALRPLKPQGPLYGYFAKTSGLGQDDAYGPLIITATQNALLAKFEGIDTKTHDSFRISK